MHKLQRQSGFSLIELMVVISIIGMLASVVIANLNDSRAAARDAKRIQDMKQIAVALQLYFNENGYYPGATQGVPNTGQIIGVGNAIDDELRPYLNPVPIDPAHDAGTGVAPVAGAAHFYSYDPQHMTMPPGSPDCTISNYSSSVYGFNRAETLDPSSLHKDTCSGGDMWLHHADYNVALTPAAP